MPIPDPEKQTNPIARLLAYAIGTAEGPGRKWPTEADLSGDLPPFGLQPIIATSLNTIAAVAKRTSATLRQKRRRKAKPGRAR
jgi:hypothetical protein